MRVRHAVVLSILLLGSPAFAQDAKPASQPAAKAPAASTKAPARPETAPTASQPVAGTTASPSPKAAEKPAEAVSGETQKWWQGLLVTLIEAAVAVLFPILGVLGMALLRKWKLKVEQDKLDWVLAKALGFAEQKAKVALKDGKPMEGPELAKAAVEHGSKLLAQYKLPKKLGDFLGDLIEAKLGEKVVDAGGAKKVVNGGAS